MHALEMRIPPLLLFFLWGGAMTVVPRYFPPPVAHLPGLSLLGAIIAAAGTIFAFAGIVAFRRHRTTVNPFSPDSTSVIVTSGVYRYSRNPMYLGLVAVLLGWAIHLAHPVALLLVLLFLLYMQRFQIIPEERALTEKFGEEYRSYLDSTRRWI